MRITSSACWQMIEREMLLGRSYRVFEANGMEIKAFVDLYGTGHSQADPIRVRHVGRIHSYVSRLVHNYVSSALTLRDHCRRYIGACDPDQPFAIAARQEAKGRFAESPLPQFVQGLRNYALHREIPFAMLSTTVYATKPAAHEIILETAKMIDWDGWNAPALLYLESTTPRGIHLGRLVAEYDDLVAEYYEWLVRARQELYCPAFDELERTAREIEVLSDSSGIPSNVPFRLRGFHATHRAWLPQDEGPS